MIARLQWAPAVRPAFAWVGQLSPASIAPDQPPPVVAVVIGPKGDAGESYRHLQASPLTEWVVNHNLGLRPSVTVMSAGGVEVDAQVIHQSDNQLRIYFASPFAGEAHCV